MNSHRRCENCSEMMEFVNGEWIHRYGRPMSLVPQTCDNPKPFVDPLEQLCKDLVLEHQANDSDPKIQVFLVDQITEHLKAKGLLIKEVQENPNG